MNYFKKTVTYITTAEPSDHIISHVLQDNDDTTEMMVKMDYHVQ